MYLENKNKFHKIPELSACAHVNLVNILKTLELLWFIRGEGHTSGTCQFSVFAGIFSLLVNKRLKIGISCSKEKVMYICRFLVGGRRMSA